MATGPTLGPSRDYETSAYISANATGDDSNGTDDEDGVTFGSIRVGQLGASATVVVQGITTTAKLDAWIDWNGDGSWGGPLEQVASSVPMVNGNNPLSFDVPSTAIDGTVIARFRLSTAGNLGPEGAASDGEVEDYAVTVSPPAASSGLFGQQTAISTTANGPDAVYAADVDGDGDMDVLSASRHENKIAWFENSGSQNFTAHTISTAADGPYSVYTADLDGDGDTDVLSASTTDDKIAWYENDGSQNFAARTISILADSARSVYAADVDGDGDMDVLSASALDHKIAWYENDGSQNFTARTISTAAIFAVSVVAADVDGDGDTDVLSASAGDNKIAWYENNGSQNFTVRNISTVASGVTSVFVADVDGDGDLDVLSASNNDDKIAWYQNDGSQNFTAQVISTAADGAQKVFAADMDGDGDIDVLSVSFLDDKVAWYQNDGSQNFTAHTLSISADSAYSVHAADLDGDGDLDVIAASRLDKITWYENLNTLDFGDAPVPYPTTLAQNGAIHQATGPTLGANRDSEANGTHSVNANADDNTGAPDDEDGVTFGTIRVGQLGASATVVVQGIATTAKLDAWIDWNGDGSWGGPLEQVASSVPMVNGNNPITFDVPSTAIDGTVFARFRLSTTGNLGPEGTASDGEVEDYAVTVNPPVAADGLFGSQNTISTTANGPLSVYAADVDGDGDIDALSASFYDDKIAWYENDGSQNFTPRTISTTAADGPRTVVAEDVDGDGDIDVLSASAFDDKIAWYENDGSQNFTARTISIGADQAESIFATDVDGDGDMDVLSASPGDDKIAWYENDGTPANGGWITHIVSTTADYANSVFAADVDGDGDMDVLSASEFDDKIAWYENNGNQIFTARVISTAADGAQSVFAADVDGDGDTDVLSASISDDKIAWYENDGNQNFAARTISIGADFAFSVFAADVDGDGDTDVLSASAFDDKVAWYQNDGSQNFTARTISTAANTAVSIFAADVDGDGDLDVLSASRDDDKIAWYENLALNDAPVLAGPFANPGFEAVPDLIGWSFAAGPNGGNVTVVRTSSGTEGAAHATVSLPRQFGPAGWTGYGPTLRSSHFSLTAGQVVNVDWRVIESEDDPIAIGRLVQVGGSAVATLFNGTFSSNTAWATATAVAPAQGTYMLEFQVGSFDASNGGAVGADLLIDKVILSPPVFGSPIAVLEGQSQTIGSANLLAFDPDNTAAELTYTLTSLPARGTIQNNSVALALGATFTQQDLNDGTVAYQHDGSETTSDSFGFQLSDGASSSATMRVSLNSSGGQGNSGSYEPTISADGRFVAFYSHASNLVAGDTNGTYDVFVRDLVAGTATRVSLDSSGGQGNSDSYDPSISADGRYVAFWSYSSNLAAGDTDGFGDIFVRDLVLGTTTVVSTGSAGKGDNSSFHPSISADGRYVAFGSIASNLAAGDTDSITDIFVRDRVSGTTTLVSTGSAGKGNNLSSDPSISADGRYVAFWSYSSNLAAGDTDTIEDIFVRDLVAGTTTLVSTGSLGKGNGSSRWSSISADGRYVAFHSTASNLAAGDTDGLGDIFVRDLVLGTTTLVSTGSAGKGNNLSEQPSISADGRYVAFWSIASNLVAGDTNGTDDVFVRDLQMGTTTRISLDSSGSQGNSDSYEPSISADGRYVALASGASNLVAGDTNTASDIFVRDTGILTGSVAVTVTPVNDAPVNTTPGPITTNEDTPVTIAGIAIGDLDAGVANIGVTLSVGSGTLTLETSVAGGVSGGQVSGNGSASVTITAPLANINTMLANAAGLTYSPHLNVNGTTSLTVATSDLGNSGQGGARTDSDNISITVTPVNDAPSFTLGANPTVNESAGPQNIPGFATNIAPGPATAVDEVGQMLTFNVVVTATTGDLSFLSPPAISPTTGNLTFTATPITGGTATVSVTLSDNGGGVAPSVNTSAAQTFTITVTPAGLRVSLLTPTPTGFVADFTRILEPGALNLYDQGGALGAADVTLTDSSANVIRGSVGSPGTELEFAL